MNIKQNELIIGAMMSLATLIVIVGILWLGKSNFFVQGLPLNLMVKNAAGVSQGDEVYFRGLKIGTVRDAELSDGSILLKLKLEGIASIPKDSKFTIKDYSLVGGKIIEIDPGASHQNLNPEDTVWGYTAEGMAELITDIRSFKPAIQKVLTNMDSLTGKTTLRKLNLTLHKMNDAVESIRKLLNGDVKETFTNVNEITSENKEKISELFTSLNENSTELKNLLGTANATTLKLDSLLSKLNNKKSTLSALATNDSLYENLTKAANSIDSLAKDIKKNPKKYLKISIF
jgi:phospholipid/cholesterol/gamma-HCH transport system substrate-binding protein